MSLMWDRVVVNLKFVNVQNWLNFLKNSEAENENYFVTILRMNIYNYIYTSFRCDLKVKNQDILYILNRRGKIPTKTLLLLSKHYFQLLTNEPLSNQDPKLWIVY